MRRMPRSVITMPPLHARNRSPSAAASIARPMATPAAVIFDNDGLLLDTESVWTRGEADLFRQRGREFTPEHKLELIGTSAQDAAGSSRGSSTSQGASSRWSPSSTSSSSRSSGSGSSRCLARSSWWRRCASSRSTIGLVSNSPLRFISRAIELVGLEGAFGVVVSGHEVAAPKPAPDPYLVACERLGVAPGA